MKRKLTASQEVEMKRKLTASQKKVIRQKWASLDKEDKSSFLDIVRWAKKFASSVHMSSEGKDAVKDLVSDVKSKKKFDPRKEIARRLPEVNSLGREIGIPNLAMLMKKKFARKGVVQSLRMLSELSHVTTAEELYSFFGVSLKRGGFLPKNFLAPYTVKENSLAEAAKVVLIIPLAPILIPLGICLISTDALADLVGIGEQTSLWKKVLLFPIFFILGILFAPFLMFFLLLSL